MFAPRPRAARIGGLLAATATMLAAGLVPATPSGAVEGPGVPAGSHPSAVRIGLGEEVNGRACTGTLVDHYWVLTAASCFAATAGGPVQPGRPALRAVAGLSDGTASEITEIVPRTDRDVVLARLAAPATTLTPATLAAAVPNTGAALTAAGFGRTKTVWVPDTLHTGAFSLNATGPTTLTITGKGSDVLCKGDTGGPLLNAANELVAVNSRSWQGGCLGAPAGETRTGAVSARVDDLGDWLRQVRFTTASLKNVHHGKCVLISWRTPDNDAPATQHDCLPQYADQIWKITPVNGAGDYQIRNGVSGRCLYVPWQTPDYDAPVLQVDCDPRYADQVWKITPVGGGQYQIRNVHHDRCMYVPWQTPDNGALVRQADCDAQYGDQLWRI
ncbi:RICIN domain-containing protein [Streptomyces sp. NBC_00249]|uniref:RICIN domain-containing protein n=1 Tax=Streptomyces sp. NBC_00249 TaxID=2975690 RepID=UPI002250A928|nr:RICIN domain-containing protein [Streptomyces sp. NBC_00249]MCX5192461.1 RICIN domain-containing protein [Streptomyces sp. NBC_00249]